MAAARQLPCGAKIVVALLLAVAFPLGVVTRVVSVRTPNLSADRAALQRDHVRRDGEHHYLTENDQR